MSEHEEDIVAISPKREFIPALCSRCRQPVDGTKPEAVEEAEVVKLVKALQFYADPATYFAIGFWPDPPNGEFMDDFHETELGMKPGKRAQEALDRLAAALARPR